MNCPLAASWRKVWKCSHMISVVWVTLTPIHMHHIHIHTHTHTHAHTYSHACTHLVWHTIWLSGRDDDWTIPKSSVIFCRHCNVIFCSWQEISDHCICHICTGVDCAVQTSIIPLHVLHRIAQYCSVSNRGWTPVDRHRGGIGGCTQIGHRACGDGVQEEVV